MSAATVINRRRGAGPAAIAATTTTTNNESSIIMLDDVEETIDQIVDRTILPPPTSTTIQKNETSDNKEMELFLRTHVVETDGGGVFFLSKDTIGQQLIKQLEAFTKKRSGYFNLCYFLVFLCLFLGILSGASFLDYLFKLLLFLYFFSHTRIIFCRIVLINLHS